MVRAGMVTPDDSEWALVSSVLPSVQLMSGANTLGRRLFQPLWQNEVLRPFIQHVSRVQSVLECTAGTASCTMTVYGRNRMAVRSSSGVVEWQHVQAGKSCALQHGDEICFDERLAKEAVFSVAQHSKAHAEEGSMSVRGSLEAAGSHVAEKEARLDLPIFEAKVKELVGLMSAPHKMNAEEPTRSGVHSSPVVSRLAPTGPAASQDMEIWRWLVKLWPSARARETKLSFRLNFVSFRHA